MIAETAWNGQPISKPGLYSGIRMGDYHSQRICIGTSVSSSGLRRVLESNGGSPAHFFCEWDGNPDAVEPDEKKHLIFGRAIHHLLLGQSLFSREFIIRPNEIPDEHGVLKPWSGLGSTVKGRNAWLEKAGASGRTILTQEQVADIKGMADALSRDSLIREGILNGMIERSIVWKDKKTGLWIKCRPDAIPTSSGDFADFKTTTSVAWDDLQRTIAEFAYHQQMALIREGAREVLNLDTSTFTLVFQEKKPPYCVRSILLNDKALDLGERQNRAAIDLIARCIREQRWPGPGEDESIRQMALPDWYEKRLEKRESMQ